MKQRVLALLADGDRMLPSGEEAQFLERNLPRCTTRVLREHGHAVLQEQGADLVGILKVGRAPAQWQSLPYRRPSCNCMGGG